MTDPEASNDAPESKEKEVQPINEKYTHTNSLYETFFQIASLGDVTSIYRNRPCFLNQSRRQSLTKPATDIFVEVPASRAAVYHYTGLLIHESVHFWFNKKENVQQVGNVSTIQESALQMLEFFTKFFTEPVAKGALEEVLTFLCEISAELASKNAGRPAMSHSISHEKILETLSENEVVAQMLQLLNLVVTSLMELSSDSCMKALFEASRHGPHFSWIWLHVATLLQGSIITNLLESGAEQFESYVAEVTKRKSSQNGAPAVLNILQTEYEHKFRAISDVFNFLMSKRNPELQDAVSQLILESLNAKQDRNNSNNRLGFAFFFKLVTCSIQTLQIMVTCNSHLITPFNAVRAIRQIQTVDKSIILPNASYTDFIKQIVDDVDPMTHGVIFEMIIELIYNPDVFEGENQPELADSNRRIGEDCFPVLDVMMHRIVRIAHAPGPYKCPSQHPAIRAYSSGERLQFILNSIARHIDKSSSIIRHLHAISIANGEQKAAEIALRFLLTVSHNESKYLYILMAFITTTVPFYPSMMSMMFREFSALKILIESSLPDDVDCLKLHLNLLHNLRTLLEWELTVSPNSDDRNPYAYLKVYPGEHIGHVLTTVFGESAKLATDLVRRNEKQKSLQIFRMLTKLVDSVSASNSSRGNGRKFLVSLSHWYKMMSQLAIILKSTLLLVGKDCLEGIAIFEELRTVILRFLYSNHIDVQLQRFVHLFMHQFVAACFIDSKTLFDESFGENAELLIDEHGMNKMLDEMSQLEEGPAVLDGLKSLRMRDSALDMLHTGKLKRRKKVDTRVDELASEDAKQRVYVVLDAIKATFVNTTPQILLTNSKLLATALLNTICRDSLTCDMRFDEWDIESEFIHRHVEIDQKMSQSAFCDGILRILSETRSFAYCLPIMKSKLAVIINETEKFPERPTISDSLRTKLHNWVMMAHTGGILPLRFVYLCDLEKFATVHETYLMLLEVWRFLMYRNLTIASIDNYHSDLLRGDVDEGVPNEQEGVEKVNFSVFRLVIQNHICDAYHLFPKLFPAEYDFLKLTHV